jgi:glutamyl-tRNA synthetase
MIRVRFAPSPTGWLHVGNARAALANWLLARRDGGKFLLRFDDTDVARGREEYAEGLTRDLAWLGLTWDESFRQTERLDRYAAAAERLKASGRLYPCFESEDELKYKRDLLIKRGKPPLYDRAMLALTPEQREAAEANGKVPYWRFKLSSGEVTWQDQVLGKRVVKLTTISDPVLIRADGTFLYTFTSVVDDIETEITDIVRGEDHVTNTGVQSDIFAALGAEPPRMAHLPLLTDADGGKLSKRFDGMSLRNLRADGIEPGAVTSYLARLGTNRDPEPASLAELAEAFRFDAYSHSAARFDMRQLLALNRRLLHALPFADAAARLPKGATEPFWLAVRGNLDLLSEAGHWWQVVAGEMMPPVLEGESAFLREALAVLPAEPWDGGVWAAWVEAVKAASGRKGRALFHPLRLALTGEEQGPELRDLLPLMGRARVAERLRLAAA